MTILVTFTLLVVAIFEPWARVRDTTTKVVERLSCSHLLAYTKAFNIAGSQFLTVFEAMSFHLASLSDRIRCDQENVWRFIMYCRTVNAKIPEAANEFVLMHSDGGYCKLIPNANDLSKFQLLYLHNGNQLKRYTETVDFVQWDPEKQGTFVKTMDWQEIWNVYLSEGTNVTWTQKPVLESGVPSIGLTTPVVNGDAVETLLAVLTPSKSLWKKLEESNAVGAFNYAVLNRDNTVVVEKNIHTVNSTVIDGVEVFPKLSEIGVELWEVLEPHVSLIPENSTEEILIGEDRFLVTIREFESAVPDSFKAILVVNLSATLESAFWSSSHIQVLSFVLVCAVCVVSRYVQKRNRKKKEEKLNREPPSVWDPMAVCASCGSLANGIFRLRNLEVAYPEEIVLNKVIDNAVLNLAQPRERMFSLALTRDCNCPFCRQILECGDVDLPQPSSDLYSAWAKISFPSIALVTDIAIDVPHIEADPVRSLVIISARFIADHELAFLDFDPDLMINFITEFANTCVPFPEHKAHMICHLYQLLSGPFRYWLQNRIDILCVFFAALVKDMSLATAYEMMDSDNCDVILAHPEVFSDVVSEVQREGLLALNIFRKFVPKSPEKSVLVDYFESTVLDILFSINDRNQFLLYSEFHARVQSPEFSVHADPVDRLLFMKAIVAFCDLCPYWSDQATMIRLLDQMRDSVFTPEESSDEYFVCLWHSEVSNKIVGSWMAILTTFYPLEDIRTNFEHNKEYWQARLAECIV